MPTVSLFIMKKEHADLIVHNARVYLVDEAFSVVDAFAVRGGRIVKAGTFEAIRREHGGAEEIDLEGGFVYPGLIDAHCHFVEYGQSLRQVNLVGARSFDEILERLEEHQKGNEGPWVLGQGWDQNAWDVKAWPTRKRLDDLFPDIPVLLRRVDGHAALVNGEAIRRCGITTRTEIKGGALFVEQGELTGILLDNAISLVGRMVPDQGAEELKQSILRAQADCFSVGLTSVHDAGLDAGTLALIDQMNKSGQLHIRIYAMLSPGRENFETYLYKGSYETDHLNVSSIKLFADGALGSRGALMIEPYSDDPGNCGLQAMDQASLKEICKHAYDRGFQVNTHCIGDAANRLVLELYGKILQGKNDRRWRIEHAQIVHPDDFDTFGRFSIIPSVQTTHATSDMCWAGARVGKDRLKGGYAYKRLLLQNGWLPNGSDFPAERINPLYGFYAAVSRKDLAGYPKEGFQRENALDRVEALKAMTIWAAKAAFEENEKGSLEPGKFADFIVTDKNLMAAPEEELPHIKILRTYLGGHEVFHR